MTTDARTYVLVPTETGVETTIGFTYVNRTGEPVYLPGCRPPESPVLQKWEGGRWIDAWGPARLLCLSLPLEVAPGESLSQTLQLFAGYPDSRAHPKFEVDEIPGEYRLAWWIVRDWDPEHHAGEMVPINERVSNSFRIELE